MCSPDFPELPEPPKSPDKNITCAIRMGSPSLWGRGLGGEASYFSSNTLLA